ncbi:hypothetical protein TTHERM_00305480 (macronuclear) [Tetrahymena thermophila SB210]|uniref:Uncharacterized protein n=1 Tax=Tetrahymena thermophila (strain SB210) TaxID=312017 RepID=I7M948_TETTS|nr:hypothetical protein TTHERM_00305480 [Tetrahymena thermophila SB210]EAS00780.1 hypothetical protein TTHERM_00305480 [Tetrahymena thermophila SB210]|eukprot:XP_001021025.1 hypothetical protein TTHERM_00305480 [Tetrahymena thermophila SB210]
MFALKSIAQKGAQFLKIYGRNQQVFTKQKLFFSSKNKLYGCQKARDNYEELVMTMKKNIDIIQKSFKGKDYNYLLNSLNNLLNIGLMDHPIIEEVVKEIKDNNLHLQIQESTQMEKFCSDIIQLMENPKYRRIGLKLLEEISEKFFLLKYNQIQNIEKQILGSQDSNIKSLLQQSPKLKGNIQKYLNITNAELQKEVFEKMNLKQQSKNYKIIKFEVDKNQFVLFDEKNNQEVIIQGVDNYPYNSYDTFKQIFKEKKGQINLLITQDQPITDSDAKNTQQLNDEYYIDEINQMYKTTKDVYELKGLQLRQFLLNCFCDESYVYDFEQSQFRHRKMKIYEHLNSLYIDFIKQANSTKELPSKIVLADMPINEYINSLVILQPLNRLKETVRLCNFVTLMEKTSFSHNTLFKQGCPTCNKDVYYSEQNKNIKKVPDAYLEILSGDPKFLPLSQKVRYFGDRVYQSLLENKKYNQVLVACGSFQLYETVKIIMENDDQNADFDGYDFYKYKDELKREFGKNQREYLEKIALLEVLHEVIDNGCVRELTIKGKNRINIDQYISYIDQYTDLLSFESISPNVKFVNNSEVKKIKNCISDQLIFGLGEDKEYIQQQTESDSFFSLFSNKNKQQQDNDNSQTIIEDDQPQKSQEELEKESQLLQEEIKRHEEKIKPEHYIDKVYDDDQKDLLKQVIELINKKTLFINDQEETQRVITDRAQDQDQNLNSQESDKKNKIKFKKVVPRYKKNQDQ